MREYDALKGYPAPAKKRYVGPHYRTIENKIVASYRNREYYDGDRINGYGGFKYDGRWIPIARNMYREYGLSKGNTILQLGCEKGFLLHDFRQQYPSLRVYGTEISAYALEHTMTEIKPFVQKTPFTKLPFETNKFDLVIAIGVVYTLNLADALKCLKEIGRVGKGKSFITLAAYRTEEERKLFEWWSLLGTTILHENEWLDILKHVEYKGDYKFTTARSLDLFSNEDPDYADKTESVCEVT